MMTHPSGSVWLRPTALRWLRDATRMLHELNQSTELKQREQQVKDTTYNNGASTRTALTKAITLEDVRDLLTGFVAAIDPGGCLAA